MKNSWLLENKLIVEDLEGIISDKVISWHDFEGKKEKILAKVDEICKKYPLYE